MQTLFRMRKSTSNIEFSGIYNLPGEGLVVELRADGDALLFDRQGLQHRIVQRKHDGLDTSVEETALARMNALSTPQAL